MPFPHKFSVNNTPFILRSQVIPHSDWWNIPGYWPRRPQCKRNNLGRVCLHQWMTLDRPGFNPGVKGVSVTALMWTTACIFYCKQCGAHIPTRSPCERSLRVILHAADLLQKFLFCWSEWGLQKSERISSFRNFCNKSAACEFIRPHQPLADQLPHKHKCSYQRSVWRNMRMGTFL